jgi:hypothetical protein
LFASYPPCARCSWPIQFLRWSETETLNVRYANTKSNNCRGSSRTGCVQWCFYWIRIQYWIHPIYKGRVATLLLFCETRTCFRCLTLLSLSLRKRWNIAKCFVYSLDKSGISFPRLYSSSVSPASIYRQLLTRHKQLIPSWPIGWTRALVRFTLDSSKKMAISCTQSGCVGITRVVPSISF